MKEARAENLFPPAAAPAAPLAERLRPRALHEVLGQVHLLSEGKPLLLALQSARAHSFILWGPPGSGKTTLARLAAQAGGAHFVTISAVLDGVKEIRAAIEQARRTAQAGQRCIVFVDEIHRFNKSQQDAFLPHVESGLFTFIGATTENPSFEVNSALLSRCTVYVLEALSADALSVLLDRALSAQSVPRSLAPEARSLLLDYADGDARRLLNAAESVFALSAQAQIDLPQVRNALGAMWRRYDKGGEQFYDTISALHKAVRGSDANAALYWFARMVDGGADPRYLARRLLRMASEDIGLADPRALRLTLDAAEVYERLGSPEGELALAEAVIYLALAPKSNAVYSAMKAAKNFVKADQTRPVPKHLRNAPTSLMRNLGYGKNYRYAHDEPEAFAAGENYWPEGLEAQDWYRPVSRGLEIQLAEKMARLKQLNETKEGKA